MSTLLERFVAGEDGMAALLRALPAYAPPDRMQAWFAQAAAQADSARHAAGPGSAQAAATDAADTLQFEPPATMGAIFAAAAAQAEQAQAPQRAAIQARLEDGDDAAQVLGAPVHDSTRAWLQQQLPVPGTTAGVGAPALQHNGGADAFVGDATAPLDAQQMANHSSSSVTPGDASPAPVRAATMPASHAAQTGDAAHPTDARPAPAARRARRQRWMPALALAASVTLAVGVGLQWQATAPPAASMDAAPAVAAPADLAQAEAEQQPGSAQDNQAPLGESRPLAPASAAAAVPTAPDSALQERMRQPASAPPPAFAPPPPPMPMPAPAQPAEASVSAPAPPPPLAAPPEPAPIAAAPAADLALPSLPAPVAPSVSASVAERPSSSAHRNAAVPDAANAVQAAARNQAKPAAVPAIAATPPANDTRQPSGQLDSGKPAPVIPAAATAAPAPQDAQLSRAPPIKRAPLQKDAATQQRVQEPTAAQPPRSASTGAALPASAADDASRSARPVQLLALTTSPETWLDHALPAGQHGPVQLRIWAADPEANAFRQWLDRLRKAYSQRNVPLQLDIARDPRLPTDRVRIETVSATQPE
ncbi:hypothetical protein [Xanthomonas pisi]|uniref:Uncharacterized protein n=1 Tax=Xanthomonas pisi TaxID=56457 RepID=A0A2S7D0N7_9XANT|nr:hypothetical protein [Xanthomonas pisi]KLD71955.1 hypothetical protein Y887_03335 [Xanthomonas pisi DSM 18956]PPU67391.1 hypothetical protein XpiCFBP4643_15445 [Xanthomonas pisi]